MIEAIECGPLPAGRAHDEEVLDIEPIVAECTHKSRCSMLDGPSRLGRVFGWEGYSVLTKEHRKRTSNHEPADADLQYAMKSERLPASVAVMSLSRVVVGADKRSDIAYSQSVMPLGFGLCRCLWTVRAVQCRYV